MSRTAQEARGRMAPLFLLLLLACAWSMPQLTQAARTGHESGSARFAPPSSASSADVAPWQSSCALTSYAFRSLVWMGPPLHGAAAAHTAQQQQQGAGDGAGKPSSTPYKQIRLTAQVEVHTMEPELNAAGQPDSWLLRLVVRDVRMSERMTALPPAIAASAASSSSSFSSSPLSPADANRRLSESMERVFSETPDTSVLWDDVHRGPPSRDQTGFAHTADEEGTATPGRDGRHPHFFIRQSVHGDIQAIYGSDIGKEGARSAWLLDLYKAIAHAFQALPTPAVRSDMWPHVGGEREDASDHTGGADKAEAEEGDAHASEFESLPGFARREQDHVGSFRAMYSLQASRRRGHGRVVHARTMKVSPPAADPDSGDNGVLFERSRSFVQSVDTAQVLHSFTSSSVQHTGSPWKQGSHRATPLHSMPTLPHERLPAAGDASVQSSVTDSHGVSELKFQSCVRHSPMHSNVNPAHGRHRAVVMAMPSAPHHSGSAAADAPARPSRWQVHLTRMGDNTTQTIDLVEHGRSVRAASPDAKPVPHADGRRDKDDGAELFDELMACMPEDMTATPGQEVLKCFEALQLELQRSEALVSFVSARFADRLRRLASVSRHVSVSVLFDPRDGALLSALVRVVHTPRSDEKCAQKAEATLEHFLQHSWRTLLSLLERQAAEDAGEVHPWGATAHEQSTALRDVLLALVRVLGAAPLTDKLAEAQLALVPSFEELTAREAKPSSTQAKRRAHSDREALMEVRQQILLGLSASVHMRSLQVDSSSSSSSSAPAPCVWCDRVLSLIQSEWDLTSVREHLWSSIHAAVADEVDAQWSAMSPELQREWIRAAHHLTVEQAREIEEAVEGEEREALIRRWNEQAKEFIGQQLQSASSDQRDMAGVDARVSDADMSDALRPVSHENELALHLYLMGNTGHASFYPLIVQSLRHRSRTVQVAAIEAMRFHQSQKGSEAALMSVFHASDNPRHAAVRGTPLRFTVLQVLDQYGPLDDVTLSALSRESQSQAAVLRLVALRDARRDRLQSMRTDR